jgi:hypothetical protein
MGKYKFLLVGIIFGLIGSLYTFGKYKFIKLTLGIGLGLRHNDHVMMGIISLCVGVVALYRWLVDMYGSR